MGSRPDRYREGSPLVPCLTLQHHQVYRDNVIGLFTHVSIDRGLTCYMCFLNYKCFNFGVLSMFSNLARPYPSSPFSFSHVGGLHQDFSKPQADASAIFLSYVTLPLM